MKSSGFMGGVLCAIFAMGCFAVLDTTNKYLVATVPLLMLLWFRYLVQAVLTTVTLLPKSGRHILASQLPKLQFLRGLLLLVCSMLAFGSLQHMPVAEFTAIAMLTPLMVTLIARFFLGEHVSKLRWLFVVGGMLGALIIVRPGSHMTLESAWMPLCLVLSNSLFQILTSHMARTEHPMTMHFYTGWVGCIISTVFMLGWWTTDLSPFQWLLMLLIGGMGSLGHYLLILAYARAPAATITPYLYSGIAFAVILGWIVFAHVPDVYAIAGMSLIAACGLGAGWINQKEKNLHQPTEFLKTPS